MGNCQAAEAATLVIHHPDGKVEKVYWSLSASQVMANNPGHYVAVIITTAISNSGGGTASMSVKHLKLLRPDDTLHVGHVYRLVSFEEVLKEFASKKHVKLSKLVVKQHKEVKAKKKPSRRSVSSSCTVGGVTVASPVSLHVVGRGRVNSQPPPKPTSTTLQEQLQQEQKQENEDGGEGKLDSELEEVVQRMIAVGNTRQRAFVGGGGSALALTRHGQWRPALQSISEVGICKI